MQETWQTLTRIQSSTTLIPPACRNPSRVPSQLVQLLQSKPPPWIPPNYYQLHQFSHDNSQKLKLSRFLLDFCNTGSHQFCKSYSSQRFPLRIFIHTSCLNNSTEVVVSPQIILFPKNKICFFCSNNARLLLVDFHNPAVQKWRMHLKCMGFHVHGHLPIP